MPRSKPLPKILRQAEIDAKRDKDARAMALEELYTVCCAVNFSDRFPMPPFWQIPELVKVIGLDKLQDILQAGRSSN
jgi:hypothetical protein